MYLYINKDVLPSPRFSFLETNNNEINPAPEWPIEGKAYFVWVESEERRDYYNPSQIGEVVDLVTLFESRNGAVFLVNPRE